MNKLKHVTWECDYHVVIVPKYRKRVLYEGVKKRLGEILRQLSREKGVEIVEGNIRKDHVHMMLSIPPKLSVSEVLGYMKEKSAIRLHNEFGKGRMISQKSFWSRGYFVRTSGVDKEQLKIYIREQEDKDKRDDGSQMDFNW